MTENLTAAVVLAKWLAPVPDGVSCGGHRHHLIALWPVGCADALRDLLSVPGSRSIAHFA
jgi:molybdenum cofactor guanylyltransferase